MNLPCATTLINSANIDVDLLANESALDRSVLTYQVCNELQSQIKNSEMGKVSPASMQGVASRIAKEVARICEQSSRIQNSGEVRSWQISLIKHRVQKCLSYYHLGSRQGRIELHSTLAAIVYRYINPMRSPVSFQARYNLIEDFLQNFYIESLKVFRKEAELPENYTPRHSLEIAEYLAFTEQYARRKISLKAGFSQQLIVLRAQTFSHRQPAETAIDIELAAESTKGEDTGASIQESALQQVRSSMVSESNDRSEELLRENLITELIQYLEAQEQPECVKYLILKLQDLSAPEIDEILGLSPRQRDYLQQRFKYYVEKFARSDRWQLVHQWLGADLDQKLGMSSVQWELFWEKLSPQQQQLLELKRKQVNDRAIATALKCTLKQVQKRWAELLELAWQNRNKM
ncbi:hypothetical protein ACE1B6_05370 [Aerosakkonemataceae cyanobacterium BLCC-F154]|uniref:ATPase involved in DNA repair n=1 Tax=Floridaenema fluviatile BLCC-F154 TaxID=3153640 RepID=A0ABV4Y850_9CYAN